MREFVGQSIAGFPPFILYFLIAAAMLIVFVAIYLRITPYREVDLIKQGNCAAAVSLSGSIIGFVLPLAHAVAQAVNLTDLLLWGLLAMVVQLVSYLLVRALIPGIVSGIPQGQVAHGIFLATVSVAAGILNAACMAD